MLEKENLSSDKHLPMGPEYGAEETAAAHAPFIKIVGYVLLAQTLGLLSCLAIYQQYADTESVQIVMLTSGMIFAIGLVPAIFSYFIFRSVIAMSNEAAALSKEVAEEGKSASMEDDTTAEAMRRAKNGFKLLSFSGVCFVASTLIGISGLLSL